MNIDLPSVSTNDESFFENEKVPLYVTVVIDETDELTLLQQSLGRKTKERWSDSLLKRNEIKPLIPPLQIISGVLRPKAEKLPPKKTVAQTI